MKKLSFISLFILSCTIISCIDNNITSKLRNDDNQSTSKVENSIKTYSDLIDSFKNLGIGQTNETIYPDYYGGAYIDNNGVLIVWIKEGSDIPISLSKNSSIKIKKGIYSYNELNKIMDTINKFKEEHNSSLNLISSNIYMWFLDEKNNRVEVCLKDCSSSDIEEFKRVVIDSPAVIFKEKDTTADKCGRVDIIYKNVLE